MNFTLCRALGAASLGLALTLGGGSPAGAETQRHDDPRGDVQTISFASRANASIDITRSANSYEKRTLRMRLNTVKLDKNGYEAEWFIQTAQTVYVLLYDRTGPEPVVAFADIGMEARVGDSSLARGVPPICDGVTVKARAKRSTLSGVVPRSCINGADTVRIAAGLLKPTTDGIKVDDARRKSFDPSDSLPRYGPALRRN